MATRKFPLTRLLCAWAGAECAWVCTGRDLVTSISTSTSSTPCSVATLHFIAVLADPAAFPPSVGHLWVRVTYVVTPQCGPRSRPWAARPPGPHPLGAKQWVRSRGRPRQVRGETVCMAVTQLPASCHCIWFHKQSLDLASTCSHPPGLNQILYLTFLLVPGQGLGDPLVSRSGTEHSWAPSRLLSTPPHFLAAPAQGLCTLSPLLKMLPGHVHGTHLPPLQVLLQGPSSVAPTGPPSSPTIFSCWLWSLPLWSLRMVGLVCSIPLTPGGLDYRDYALW